MASSTYTNVPMWASVIFGMARLRRNSPGSFAPNYTARMAYQLSGRRFLSSEHCRRDTDDATGRYYRNRFVQRLQQQGNTLAEGRQHVGSAFARRPAHCRVRDLEDSAATLAKNHQPHFGFFVERARDVLKFYFGQHQRRPPD